MAGNPKRATDCGTAISITFSFGGFGLTCATGVSLALGASPPKI
jgi:hypothetical protein